MLAEHAHNAFGGQIGVAHDNLFVIIIRIRHAVCKELFRKRVWKLSAEHCRAGAQPPL